jgi:hypothetical protein
MAAVAIERNAWTQYTASELLFRSRCWRRVIRKVANATAATVTPMTT